MNTSSSWPTPARRSFLKALSALSAMTLSGRIESIFAQSNAGFDRALLEDLVAANRILAQEGVLDGYGHVSVRHDKNASHYLIARSIAPELVTVDDIVELDLDSNPVDGGTRKLYLERFIHGEIYKLRPDVHAVVHHHAPAIVPFSISKVPLKPVYHMSAFVGFGVPIFEIREAGGMTDMLVRTPQLGLALAKTLGDKPAALMRGHGAVVVGANIIEAVGRSVYLQMNARLQAQAMALGEPLTYLDPEEVKKATTGFGYERAWELWKRKSMGR